MLKKIVLPDLGEGIDSADVSEILIKPGDTVSVDDIILVLESDKASMEIPSENSGIVKEVFVVMGDEVKTGESLLSIEITSNDKDKPDTQKTEETPKEAVEKSVKPVEVKQETKPSTDKTFASPGVRRLSRELEIDLSSVRATGEKGRITKDDLHGYIKQKMVQGGPVAATSFPKIDFSQWGVVENTPLTKIQKITGERLQQAWQTIPHVTQFDEADISVLNSKRTELKKEGLKKKH